MKCIYCGCTEGKACTGGCTWALNNICDNCVMWLNKIRSELLSYISDPEVKEIEVIIKEHDGGSKLFRVLQ